jgi:hypothetical protein
MTDAGDTLRDIQMLISAIVADVGSDQLPSDMSSEALVDRGGAVADRRFRRIQFIISAGGLIAGLAAFLAYTTKSDTLPELYSATPTPLPHVRNEKVHSISGISVPFASSSPPPLSEPHRRMQFARSRMHTLTASPAGKELAREPRDRKIAITVGDRGEDGSQQGVAAVHLTGKALEDALAEDRIITQKLNNAALSALKATK